MEPTKDKQTTSARIHSECESCKDLRFRVRILEGNNARLEAQMERKDWHISRIKANNISLCKESERRLRHIESLKESMQRLQHLLAEKVLQLNEMLGTEDAPRMDP